MADVRITALPAAQAITGTELVPVVQNGLTVQTTVSAITSSPSLTQTFLTVGLQAGLPNSRYFSTGVGLGITDGGAQAPYTVALNGTSGSLETAGTGIVVKTAANTITARSFAVSGSGLSLSNGSGVSGDPTLSLSGLPLVLANTVGTGLLAVNGAALTPLTITGTASQIAVTSGNGASGNPIIAIASDPVLPGTAAVQVPSGTTGQRAGGVGAFRLNLDTGLFEGYNGSWNSFAAGSGVTSIATGTGLTGGPITSTGTISIANTTVTAAAYGSASAVPTYTVNAQGQLTSAANVSIAIPSSAITDKGLANGIATLDSGGKVPVSELPAAVLGALSYQGTWNASTNTPTLASGVGVKGYYYVVSVAGSTNLDGVTDWKVGDWAVYSGTAWQKVDNTDAVTSVNGYTGAVVLAASDVGAPTTSGTGATGTWAIGISGNAATATSATTSTNLAGGATGSLPYQSGAGATAMLVAGTNGYLLTLTAGLPSWQPAPVSGVTTFDAGTTGLTPSTATSGAVTLAGTLAITNGGTGAVNANDARTNLVAAQSGTNSDITELYALNGTSGGVAYQNATNQLIMGSAMTFDGTTLYVLGGISGGTF